MKRLTALLCALAPLALSAQGPREPDWKAVEAEALQHFQALVRFDTTDPPGRPVRLPEARSRRPTT
jgi:hypothetical protein